MSKQNITTMSHTNNHSLVCIQNILKQGGNVGNVYMSRRYASKVQAFVPRMRKTYTQKVILLRILNRRQSETVSVRLTKEQN